MNHPRFQIVQSGDGFQIVNNDGEVVAWTMDITWAVLVVRGLELTVSELVGDPKQTE